MARRGCWQPVGALLLIVAAGCGGPPAPGDLIVVTGKVYFRGQPLMAGTVVFTPHADRGTIGDLAFGEIQPDGSFKLQTRTASGLLPGVAAGFHRVTVMAIEHAAGQPRSILPSRYSDPHLSGLGCEVKAGQENSFNFKLE